MATKTKIFLSSPMPQGNVLWGVIRDSITAIFEHGPLSTFFELVKIDTEGGDAPDAIYMEQVSESQIVLTVFDNEIRQGQQDEIRKAIECGIPIIAVQLNKTLLKDTEQFVANVLYKHTKVETVNRHSEFIQYVLTAVSGLMYRRFRQTKVERLSILYTARSKEFSELGFDTISEFCEYCRELDNFDSAITITELLDLSDDKNFLLKMAVSAAFSAGISDDDEERLRSFHFNDREACLIKALFCLNDERFELSELTENLKFVIRFPDDAFYNLPEYLHTKDGLITAEFLMDVWEALKQVGKLEVFGFYLFEGKCDEIKEDIERTSLRVDVNNFLPEIEKCLNCMPRDSGEWVIIYPEVGDLRDLVIDNLDNENSEIPWHSYDLISNANCGSCGSPVEIYETVYSDFPDREED